MVAKGCPVIGWVEPARQGPDASCPAGGRQAQPVVVGAEDPRARDALTGSAHGERLGGHIEGVEPPPLRAGDVGVVLGPLGDGVRADLQDGPDLQPAPEDVQVRSAPDVLEPAVSGFDLPEPPEVEEQVAGADALTFEDALVSVRLPEHGPPARLSRNGPGHEVGVEVRPVMGLHLALGEFRDETAVG